MEPGRDRVEEWRESAADVRREPAGEGGAGRDEASESRDERNELRLGDLELLSNDGLALSVGVAGAATTKEVENEGGVVGGAAGGFWELESGVEGEGADASRSTWSLSSEDSVRGLALRVVSSEFNKDGPSPASVLCVDFAVGVIAWPFTVGLESGCSTTPLLIPLLVMLVLSLSSRLSALPDVLSAGEVGDATEGASTRGSDDVADSWSVLLPTFIILDSVDLRLDNGGMGAYSCADGMGGGKNGEPGDGKGDEEDSLLTATVSKGVSFVSGVMTAEVIPEFFEPNEERWAVTFWTKREQSRQWDNCMALIGRR